MRKDIKTAINYEIERQEGIAAKKDCIFFRISPGKEGFDVHIELSKIQNHIIKSTTKIAENQLKNYY